MKEIAIIAYSGMFPGADSVDEFAQILHNGQVVVAPISPERLEQTSLPTRDNYAKAGYLNEITHFDHSFFDISLGEAEEMTPHQRLLLQEAYKTFEKAGYRPSDLKGSNTSVYVGDSPTEYYHLAKKASPTLVAGNMKSINASRISRFFDLRGLAMSVDTTCSSTLTAISLACNDLTLEQSDQALVCGVNVLIFPAVTDPFAPMGVESPSEQCSPFSSNADGTLPGETVACILLKPLDKAIADGDMIHGVIKGIALNQDAALSSSITAPSSQAQTMVIEKALQRAGLSPSEVGLLEAHGTGTKLGDPIEIEGIAKAFADDLGAEDRVYVSAVKSNVGHTDSAAGLTGLIKVLLSFKNEVVYPSVNALPLSDFIDFAAAKVKVVTEPISWDKVKKNKRKVAGISSFGLMGTNAHLILADDAQTVKPVEEEKGSQVFCFSAKTPSSLQAYLTRFAEFIVQSDAPLASLSKALHTQKPTYDYRLVFTATNKGNLAVQLEEAKEMEVFEVKKGEPVFLLFDELVEVNSTKLKALTQQIPALNIPLKEATNPARTALLLQYAYYQLLSRSVRPMKDMIGLGLGKVLVKVLKKEVTLKEGLLLCDEYEAKKVAGKVLDQRADKLIANYEQAIHFISVGCKGMLAEAFERQAKNGHCQFHHFGYTKRHTLNENIKALTELNLPIDLKVLYDEQAINRLLLPDYVFDPIRCWIRSIEDVFSFEAFGAAPTMENPALQQAALPTLPQLQSLWSEILKTDIQAEDDFFELGGHSLNGQQLINRINEVFAINLDVEALFEHGTPMAMEQYLLKQGLTEEVENKVSAPFVQEKNPIKIGKNKLGVIPTVAQSESYPLSSAQSRMWIMSQAEEGSLAYNLPVLVELKGDYDIAHFKKAIAAVIERHEILRTVFKETSEGEVRQWIRPSADFNLEIAYEDFRGKGNLETLVNDYVREDNYHAFDLENGPLLRAALLQVADDHYGFYYNMHHIVSDAWSLEVLAQEVLAYYESYQSEKTPQLPELRIQYKDYAAWKLAELESEENQKHREYWLNRLAGDLPVIDLPTNKTRPEIRTHNGQSLQAYLPKETTEALLAFSREQRGSLYMTLLAAWNVLLYRYTAQQDVIIGSPIAGRDQADLENQIGCYINSLTLRNQVNPEDSFLTFYDQIKTSTLGAYAHQMYSFDRLVEDLGVVRDMSRSPLFDVLMVLHNAGEKRTVEGITQAELEGISASGVAGVSFSRIDLEISFEEMRDCFSFNISYNTDVYEREMVEGLIHHFKQILAKLLAQPSTQIGQVDYLAEAEKKKLLETYNATKADYPKDKTVVDLFCEQVAKNPTATALVYGEISWTYQELDACTNQLAAYLKANYKIQPNDLIGIKMDRNEWMIAAVLGILKAGAAYVPIDPVYPAERMAYLLKDSECQICIDEAEIEKFKASRADYSTETVASKLKPTHLAYVIYTSGSTGKPKGVMIEHGSLMNYLSWGSGYYLTDQMANHNFGLFTTLSFDLTVTSLFLPLISGHRLTVFNTADDIVTVLNKYLQGGISAIKLTPAHINLLDLLELEKTDIELAIVGGDVLHQNQIDRLRKLNPDIRIINEYGPTESTVGCIVYEILPGEAPVLIGRPIANTKVFLLNEALGMVPEGVIGEIGVAGDGLARGYLGRPKLTREKFVKHPLAPGSYLYRTGDLGRWLPDGNMEFLGRKDQQVKVKGYRIELTEIEHHLQSKKEIEAAVVTILESAEGDKELVAYIVAEQAQTVAELMDYLAEKIPDYMLPAYYIPLKEFPLTVNGKIDKSALPAPGDAGLSSGDEYVAPSNEVEEKLVEIWTAILRAEQIGVKDNFFALGGDSIKAIKVLSKIKKTFALRIRMESLLNHGTIEELAANISLLLKQAELEANKDQLTELEI